jgi:CBS domain-containing protein
MQVDRDRRVVGEWIAARPQAAAAPEAFRWLAGLLRSEGVELTSAPSLALRRGTPVYVEAGADVVEVQRLMASNHIRSLPVLAAGEVIGFVDLVDLALTADLAE